MVRLHDGREVSSSSQEWRHECEARWILKLPSLRQRREWLAGLERVRGKEAVQRLKTTMEAIWAKR